MAKLRHKVSEGKKKKRKLAKKNPQWKSRLPKDPGIPNNLPFKDQILAEIADERRRVSTPSAVSHHQLIDYASLRLMRRNKRGRRQKILPSPLNNITRKKMVPTQEMRLRRLVLEKALLA